MANIKSAKKRILVNAAKTAQNRAVKTNLKTVLKQTETAIAKGGEEKETAVSLAFKKIDKACAKGILKKNTAARRKSALARKLNKSAS